MYTVTDAYKQAIQKPSRRVRAFVEVGGVAIPDDGMLQTIKISRAAQSEGKLIGNAISQSAEIKVMERDGNAYTVNEFDTVNISIGMTLEDDSVEYIPMPPMCAEKPEHDTVKKTLVIKCFDDMQKLGAQKVRQALITEYPITMREHVQQICDLCDIRLSTKKFNNEDVLLTESPNLSGDESCRDAIAWVAEAAGSNAVIDRDGALTFKGIMDTAEYDIDIDGERYFDLKVGEPYGKVNSVVLARSPQEDNVYEQDEEAVEHDGVIEYRIDNNPYLDYTEEDIRYETKNLIAPLLLGLEYVPFELDWRGDPAIDVGDIVTLIDVDGNKRKSLYMYEEVDYMGGMRTKGGAYDRTKTATQYGHARSERDYRRATELYVDKNLGEIKSEVSIVFEGLDETKRDIEEGNKGIEELRTAIKQTADNILTTVSKVGGNNLLRNSVGFKSTEYWSVQENTNVQIRQDGNIDQNTESGSGFLIENGAIEQEFKTIAYEKYTIAFRYTKDNRKSHAFRVVLLPDNITILDIAEPTDAFVLHEYTFTAVRDSCSIAFIAGDTNVGVYDARITIGDTAQPWTQASGEVYGKNILLDESGLTIRNIGGDSLSLKINNHTIAMLDKSGKIVSEYSSNNAKTRHIETEKSINIGGLVTRALSSGRVIIYKEQQ